MQSVTEKINKIFGWHFLAKEAADYCNCSFFEIMDKPAVDVAGIALIIRAKIKVIKNK